jgi:sodium/potassium-transporting ATPase subunit alpha
LIGFLLDNTDKSNLYLFIVLTFVVIATGLFSFFQTSKSASLMAQFKNFIPPTATVRRNGDKKEIDASKLVPGDIVLVKGGDNIPADIRIFVSNEMKVNNASLTGESEDLDRKPDEITDNPLESKNLAFFGTACT